MGDSHRKSRGGAATRRTTTGLTAETRRGAEDAEGTAQAVPRTELTTVWLILLSGLAEV